MASTEKKIYTSAICIDGKRIAAMREIAKAAFSDSFLFIEVYDGRFVITVNDKINMDSYERFKDKYKLCKVRVYREVLDLSILKKK